MMLSIPPHPISHDAQHSVTHDFSTNCLLLLQLLPYL